jgi:hypothetical protein
MNQQNAIVLRDKVTENSANEFNPKSLSMVQKEQLIIEMRAAGRSMDFIANELKMSKSTVYDKVIEMRFEIENRKFVMAEEMINHYESTNNDMLKHYLEIRKKAIDELNNRNFEEMNTKDLINFINFLNQKVDGLKSEFKFFTDRNKGPFDWMKESGNIGLLLDGIEYTKESKNKKKTK